METLPRVLALLLLFFIGIHLATSQGLSLDGQVRPNVSMIEVTSTSQQIDCTSPGDLKVGTWHFPSGAAIPEGSTPPVYAVYRDFTKIALLNVQRTLPEEGIYSCRIPAQSGTILSLYYVGLYNSVSAGTPQLEDTVSLKVIDSPDFLFSLNCPSSSFPPTTVTWSRNGASLPDNVGQSFQVLKDALSTKFDNVLHVTESLGGTFTCEVRNSAGANSRSIFVKVPSLPPGNVSRDSIGDNMVRVSWTPPTDVTQYVVTYSSSLDNNTITINSGTTTSVTLENITVGVAYDITVQANGDIPGPISAPVSITLTAPPPPSAVTIDSRSSTSISLSWDRINTGDVLGYRVTYTPVNWSCEGIPGGERIISEGDATSYHLDGLQEYINYSIVLQTKGREGYGRQSAPVYERTLSAAPDPPVLQSAVSSNSQSLVVSWLSLDCGSINSEGVDQYIIRYGNADIGDFQANVTAPETSTTISNSLLKPFTKYAFAVAAKSSVGISNYSTSMMAVILQAPDAVVNLTATPDITSLLISWNPPMDDGSRKYLTRYLITYRLFKEGSNPLNSVMVDRNVTTYEVEKLLPNLTYEVRVQAAVEEKLGQVVTVVVSTKPIGRVVGVRVQMLSPTSVNVSWIPLVSGDIDSYLVDYYQVESAEGRRRRRAVDVAGRVEFPGNSSWGVVQSLQAGKQYEFQVTAAVLLNGGVIGEGKVKSPLTMDSAVTLTPAGGGLSNSAIAGIVVALAIVCICVVVLVLVGLKLWLRESSGRFVIRRKAYDYQPDRSPSVVVVPLPDFEPFAPAAKPVITSHPRDTTALEGEVVHFEPRVTGIPAPTIAWYHEGILMTSDYATEVSENGTLSFVCVEHKHTGMYRFTVSNSDGSVQGQVQLKVVTEDQQRDESSTDTVESSRVRVEELGAYCEELHANNDRGFREQFYKLPSKEEEHSAKWGQHPEHRNRNRFTNIIVYDDNRVKLKPISGSPEYQHDYVNASPINGYFMGKKFVTTQGPTENTVVDFWRLVWQLRTPTIVMITNLTENGKCKCVRYWPEGAQADYGPFKVVVSGEKVYSNYTIRSFHVNFTRRQQNPLKVVQYQFTSWPDHGVPDYVGPMLSFHRRVKAEHLSMLGPILAHCSAGVGRSGTYIAIDIALQQASGEGYVDIPAIITGLRNQRMKMVQTQDQYTFVHDAVLESLVCGNTQIFIHEMQQAMENLQRWDSKTGSSGFQTQFRALEQMTPKLAGGICTVGEKHKEKNRPNVPLPTDKYRVVLRAEHPDYINATFINGYKKKNKYILTQGPMQETSRDFWKMVYERNASSIVMLSGMVENEEEVCHKYWPTQGIESYGEYAVSMLEQTMHDCYLERIYSLTDSKSGQAHRVTQFQVINWDQYGVILNRMAVLNIINAATTRQNTNQLGPIVVHCSDTVTRSAIFCAVSNVVDCCKIEGVVDIFQVVKILRSQCPGAIPTVEQYQIVHDLVLYFIQNMLPR